MKIKIKYFIIIIITTLFFKSLTSAKKTDVGVSLNSVKLNENNTFATASITLGDAFKSKNKKIFLFSVSPANNGSIDGLLPIAESTTENSQIEIKIPFYKTDLSSALQGYVLAISDGGNGYIPVSKPVYISNVSQLAHNSFEYPIINSKKGLQVQLFADAQLLGIKHTVLNVYLNDFLHLKDEKCTSFIYGNKEYKINQTALDMLDYRVKSLSDAGIHIYMNILLSFDSKAPENIYFPNAKGDDSTMYAINVTSNENIKLIAAILNFLSNRYTQPEGVYGFCGSYIIGHEINNEAMNNSAGILKLDDYVNSYSTLLRIADIALRTSYNNARVYTSISNQWNISNDQFKSELFGGYDFLIKLTEQCQDIPFGISVNPYPSELSKTDFWNDDNAINSIKTNYITIKNLNVFTDFLKTKFMLYNGKPRHAIVGEFGVSGKYGDESELLQAAAYAYAYYSVCNNELIESFIWHRHVDHSGEIGLYFGLFSSDKLILEPEHEKEIHKVIYSIDAPEVINSLYNIDKLLAYLPINSWNEINSNSLSKNTFKRNITNLKSRSLNSKIINLRSELLFDFSESLYNFYPSENSQYLEQYNENNLRFMRISLLPVSPVEYMGASCKISDISRMQSAKYISIKLRVTSKSSNADFKLLILGTENNSETILDCSSKIDCGDWVELYFPLNDYCFSETAENYKLKIWVKGIDEIENNFYLDLQSIKLYFINNIDFHLKFFKTVIILLVFSLIISTVIFVVMKNKKLSKHK